MRTAGKERRDDTKPKRLHWTVEGSQSTNVHSTVIT